jgi:arginine-tRNA-protein transferase
MHHAHTSRQKASDHNTFSLLTTVHESEAIHLIPIISPAHNFTVILEPASFSQEKFDLYSKYQTEIHHDAPSEISPIGFKRFLCTSPISANSQNQSLSEGGTVPQLLGSYHASYYLDSKLIALSVLDLLPHAVSGVYFLYDPAYAAYSLGKISAMREIALALEGGYQYYYMGFWIEGCKKMRYKGEYKPQMVLEPERLEWGALEDLEGTLKREREIQLDRDVAGDGRIAALKQETDEAKADADANDAEDEDDATLATPTAIARSDRTLLDVGMAGITSLPFLLSTLDLDATKVQIGRGARKQTVQCDDLMSWDDGEYLEAGSLKGIVAELVACLGVEVAGECVVDLSS